MSDSSALELVVKLKWQVVVGGGDERKDKEVEAKCGRLRVSFWRQIGAGLILVWCC